MNKPHRIHFSSFLDQVETSVDELIPEPEMLYAHQTPAQIKAARKRRLRKLDPDVEKQAQKVLENRTFRKLLCPVLKSISTDAFDIAKIATPILLSLSLSHTITLPLLPTAYAAVAVLIARMGVAEWCENYKANARTKKP
jgi:hypothetical protein